MHLPIIYALPKQIFIELDCGPICFLQVQAAVGGSGWGQINEEGLKALGGLHFERRQQDAEEDGSSAPSTSATPSSSAAGEVNLARQCENQGLPEQAVSMLSV